MTSPAVGVLVHGVPVQDGQRRREFRPLPRVLRDPLPRIAGADLVDRDPGWAGSPPPRPGRGRGRTGCSRPPRGRRRRTRRPGRSPRARRRSGPSECRRTCAITGLAPGSGAGPDADVGIQPADRRRRTLPHPVAGREHLPLRDPLQLAGRILRQREQQVVVASRLPGDDGRRAVADLPALRERDREAQLRVEEIAAAHDAVLGVVAVDESVDAVEVGGPGDPAATTAPRRSTGDLRWRRPRPPDPPARDGSRASSERPGGRWSPRCAPASTACRRRRADPSRTRWRTRRPAGRPAARRRARTSA